MTGNLKKMRQVITPRADLEISSEVKQYKQEPSVLRLAEAGEASELDEQIETNQKQ